MQLEKLKIRFFDVVSPALPNEWEVEDVLSHLLELPDQHVDSLFDQVAVIWPVSHSLCFAYLLDGVKAITIIPNDLVAEWSRQILALYETGGLLAARKFMAEPQRLFLDPVKGLCGVNFSQVSGRMQLYLNGISGRRIELGVSQVPQTDTNRILVPDYIDVFPTQQENTLFYKFIISLQWSHIESRIFETYLDQEQGGGEQHTLWFESYSNILKAKDLFAVLQFFTAFRRLEESLPGLLRRARPLCRALIEEISAVWPAFECCLLLKTLLLNSVAGSDQWRWEHKVLGGRLVEILGRLVKESPFRVLPELYAYFDGIKGGYDFGSFALVLGQFEFDAAAVLVQKRREEEKNAFVALLADAIGQSNTDEETVTGEDQTQKAEGSSLILTDDDPSRQDDKKHGEFLLENAGAELSQELKALMSSIEDDLGELPEAYVQAAAGMAVKGVNTRDPGEVGDSWMPVSTTLPRHTYDEWDYRRGGYRTAWCSLYEKSVNPVKSTFIEDTRRKYKGQLHKIRRQFEMLRNQDRFARRRRYGDDIDFDALVDALGDAKAGIVPSDRLFLRLLRDQREISTYFLVDMSNSTEGWVGTAVKESLVLMAEAMEIVGDPYAIYGFSGMRRSKSEVFPVKELDEPYSNAVKERITGIGPKEYTRMGPPIRHLSKKILACDSRVRLLIVFSDGKPEDYDDYKGKYAIEDTRKAILEARGAGIHVFCVTIDKTAHEYLGHMFGFGQFVFIDNVDMLPAKMVELYRRLTC